MLIILIVQVFPQPLAYLAAHMDTTIPDVDQKSTEQCVITPLNAKIINSQWPPKFIAGKEFPLTKPKLLLKYLMDLYQLL